MLIDAFIFYNELDVLEIRLNELDQYVDQFILVESELTHSGTSKELFFEKNKQRYAKWLHKINHIIIKAEDMPTDTNPWSREKYQRECVLKGLHNVSDEAIVMVSDVDEIPDMTRVQFTNLPAAVHMWMFEYSFDFLFTGEPWIGTIITTSKSLKKDGPNFFRDNRWRLNIIPRAGWHLSSFGNAKHVLNKIKTYAHHADVGIFAEKTEDVFGKIIKEGIHHDGKTKLVPRTPDIPLPHSIRNKFISSE